VDGVNWERVDRISVPMNKKISVGLAVCAHNNIELNSTLFDDVEITTP
jgi:hypothetical protein